jgi:hypothetical protein
LQYDDLVRQFVDDGGGIELGGGCDVEHAGERQRRHEISPKTDFRPHHFLPFARFRIQRCSRLVVGAMLAGVVPVEQDARQHA